MFLLNATLGDHTSLCSCCSSSWWTSLTGTQLLVPDTPQTKPRRALLLLSLAQDNPLRSECEEFADFLWHGSATNPRKVTCRPAAPEDTSHPWCPGEVSSAKNSCALEGHPDLLAWPCAQPACAAVKLVFQACVFTALTKALDNTSSYPSCLPGHCVSLDATLNPGLPYRLRRGGNYWQQDHVCDAFAFSAGKLISYSITFVHNENLYTMRIRNLLMEKLKNKGFDWKIWSFPFVNTAAVFQEGST